MFGRVTWLRKCGLIFASSAALGLVGPTVATATASEMHFSLARPQQIVRPDLTIYTPHSNYFYTESSCEQYGDYQISGGMAGAESYYCYQNPGQIKWSIDIFLEP